MKDNQQDQQIPKSPEQKLLEQARLLVSDNPDISFDDALILIKYSNERHKINAMENLALMQKQIFEKLTPLLDTVVEHFDAEISEARLRGTAFADASGAR